MHFYPSLDLSIQEIPGEKGSLMLTVSKVVEVRTSLSSFPPTLLNGNQAQSNSTQGRTNFLDHLLGKNKM